MANYRPDDARGELLRVRRDIANVENQLALVGREVENATELGDKERVGDCRHIRNCLWKEKEQLRIQETIFLKILFAELPPGVGQPIQYPGVVTPQPQNGQLQMPSPAAPSTTPQQPPHIPQSMQQQLPQVPQQLQQQPPQHHTPHQSQPGQQAQHHHGGPMHPMVLPSGEYVQHTPTLLSQGLAPGNIPIMPMAPLVPPSPALKPSQPTIQHSKSRRRMHSPPPGGQAPGVPGAPMPMMGAQMLPSHSSVGGGYDSELANPEGYEVNRSSESKVIDVWREWKEGINGGPAVERLEEARKRDRKCIWWKHKNDYKYWSKQMRIIHAVDKKSVELGGDLEAAICYWEDILSVEFEGSISKLREALGGEKAPPAGSSGSENRGTPSADGSFPSSGSGTGEMSSFKRQRKELLQRGLERMKQWPQQQAAQQQQQQQQQQQMQQQQLQQHHQLHQQQQHQVQQHQQHQQHHQQQQGMMAQSVSPQHHPQQQQQEHQDVMAHEHPQPSHDQKEIPTSQVTTEQSLAIVSAMS